MIPYGRQEITEEDIKAVEQILRSDFLTQGPTVPKFESIVTDYCEAKYGVAVNSATSALHIACLALGLKSGDRLWTSPITFVASANCALYCGATIDFVDIDPATYNISIKELIKKLKQAKNDGTLPKILIPVHFAGQPCDMEKIFELSKEYGFRIIEDASHAIGSKQNGVPTGKCLYSDITVFSFHPVKIITTGEGGMAVTNNIDLAEKMQLLRSHGITRDKSKMQQTHSEPWYYEQIALGFNYRMTDIQAALGISQIMRINKYITRRHEIANHYNKNLKDLPIKLPLNNNESAFHLYVIRLNLDVVQSTREAIFNELRARNLGVNVHYIPVYKQPYFKKLLTPFGHYPESEKYYEEAISLPIYPSLSNIEIDNISLTLREIILS